MQNTFQAVLTSDGESSYALLLYGALQWSQADSRGSAGLAGSGELAESGESNPTSRCDAADCSDLAREWKVVQHWCNAMAMW